MRYVPLWQFGILESFSLVYCYEKRFFNLDWIFLLWIRMNPYLFHHCLFLKSHSFTFFFFVLVFLSKSSWLLHHELYWQWEIKYDSTIARLFIALIVEIRLTWKLCDADIVQSSMAICGQTSSRLVWKLPHQSLQIYCLQQDKRGSLEIWESKQKERYQTVGLQISSHFWK